MYVPKKVILLAVVALALLQGMQSAVTTPATMVGYGQHTEGPTKVLSLPGGDKLVVGPLTASFSVGLNHALCAVGEVGGEGAPFNMLVYAAEITSSVMAPDGKSFTLAGTARSITMSGSAVLEDALTPFSATAVDGGPGLAGDAFHISIDTVLWPHTTFGKDLDGNPLPLFAGDVAIWTDLAAA